MSKTKINKTQAGDGIWTADNLVAGSGISIQQVPQPVIDENTIVLCHLDDNLKDEVSGNNISNYITSIEYTEGKFNKGVTSSSSDSYLQFRDENNLITGNYTVDFWLYPKIEMYPNGYLYISHHSGNGYQIRLRENVFSLGSYVTGTGTKITNASYPSGVSFTLNTWHHFAYVNDDTNSKVYVFLDGNLIHSATRTYQDEGIYQVACVGYKNKKPIIFDEIRVSNVARYQGNKFTPYTEPYSASSGPAQYAINNTKADPDLSSYLQNTATGTGSLTINGTGTNTRTNSINIGKSSYVEGDYSVAIGASSTSHQTHALNCATVIGAGAVGNNNHTAIGYNAHCTGSGARTIAIGSDASAWAQNACQIGVGDNGVANTLKFLSTTIVDANGKVPLASLPIVQLTQAAYDALATKDANTLYIIIPETSSAE